MFFDMFKPEDFYRNFDTDYFLFAQEINQANLDNKELFESILKKFPWVEEKSYRLSILMQIRFQTLLCINTLFELVFNLLPDKEGYIPDKELILRMNMDRKAFSSLEIANWVNGKESKLDQLQKPIEYKNGEVKELAYHLFYLTESKSEKFDESISHLLEMLKVMGKQIADTSELNSYKHGMRGVVNPSIFSMLGEKGKELLKFDFKEATQFYTYHSDKKCFTVHFKTLDLKRNINFTVFATLLMKAIINPRKKIFHKNQDKEEIINVLITEEIVKALSTNSKGYFHLRFSNCKEKS